MPNHMINGWTLIALMTCLAAFGNWCFRPRNAITGGGGIGYELSSFADFYELIPPSIIDAVQSVSSVLSRIGRWLLAVSTGFGRSPPDTYELVIAVMSRLPNVEKRNMIRKTWKTLSSEATGSVSIRSKVYFVMPEQPCPLDPNWRLHDSGCDPWQVIVPPNANENVHFRPIRVAKSMIRPGLAYDGMGFKIKFPINIHNLGIAKRGLMPYALKGINLTVQVVEATRANNVLVAVNFTKLDLDEIHSDDGYIYKPIMREISLPRGFEGKLQIKALSLQTNNTSFSSKEDWRNTNSFSGIYIHFKYYVL